MTSSDAAPKELVLRTPWASLALSTLFLLPLGVFGLGVPLLLAALGLQVHGLVDVVYAGAFVVAAALGGAFGGTVMAIWALGVLRLFVAERVEREGRTVRVRVDRGWGRRTDVRFAREALRGAETRPWQGGTRQLWIAHESGASFRVSGPSDTEAAAHALTRCRRMLGAASRAS